MVGSLKKQHFYGRNAWFGFVYLFFVLKGPSRQVVIWTSYHDPLVATLKTTAGIAYLEKPASFKRACQPGHPVSTTAKNTQLKAKWNFRGENTPYPKSCVIDPEKALWGGRVWTLRSDVSHFRTGPVTETLSVPQSTHLRNGDNNPTQLIGLLWGLEKRLLKTLRMVPYHSKSSITVFISYSILW